MNVFSGNRERTKKKPRGAVAVVREHLQPYTREITALSILGLISAAANGSVPFITGKFFDALVLLSQGETVTWQGLPLWGTLLLAWVVADLIANNIDWLSSRIVRRVETSLEMGIQSRGFAHLLQLPLSFHKQARIGEVLEEISKASWRTAAIMRNISVFAPQLLSIIVGITLAAVINVWLASVLLVGVVTYVVVLSFYLRPAAETDRVAHKLWNEAWGDSAERIYQVEAVKQAATERHEIDFVREKMFKKAFPWWMKVEHLWNNISFFQRLLVFVTRFSIFLLSVHFIAEGVITIGELVALNGYAGMFFGPFVTLGHQWQVIQNGLTSAVAADKTFQVEKEVYNPKGAVVFDDMEGRVEFDKVTFSYEEGQKVGLQNISFVADPGEVIALVGESGVGKSTAVSLISAYFFPTEGQVLVDGVDTQGVNLTSLRRHIGVVPQEIALFNDTIGTNIKYGTFNATQEQIEHAAQEAHIAGFIEELPKKYETLVGERGMKLSVGQKQRVAIARAILRDPAILILDEPTSALDAKTEQHITEALERLMEGRTTFIIAHRLSTVRRADKILVFDKGQIVERGTHDELIAKKEGVYKRLYEYQIGLH